MNSQEFEERFDTLYNNITSNQAPGLNSYEKCVFLTKSQDELLKNYFSNNSKGNNLQVGFDGSPKRQIDFSVLTTSASVNNVSTPARFDPRSNSVSIDMPAGIMMIINELVQVQREGMLVNLVVAPLKFDEYNRLMAKPYKRPVKSQAWRLINSDTANKADLIVGPSDTVYRYIVRYIRAPKPIIIGDLDGLTLNGYEYGVGPNRTQGCELDEALHEEILQRAVELAKVSWTATGQDNAQIVLQAGQRSE